jgi:hypothetical protein
MASSAALLVDANLLVTLGAAPEPAPLGFLFPWSQGHIQLLFHLSAKQIGMIVNPSATDNVPSRMKHNE